MLLDDPLPAFRILCLSLLLCHALWLGSVRDAALHKTTTTTTTTSSGKSLVVQQQQHQQQQLQRTDQKEDLRGFWLPRSLLRNYLRSPFAAAAAAAAAATAAAAAAQEEDDKNINNNNNHNNYHVRPDGVGFQRWIEVFPFNNDTAHAATAVVHVEPATACRKHDAFGDNDCHFMWGTKANFTYTFRLGQVLQAEDYVDGHLMLDGYLPYHFRCAVCGTDCMLEIPIIHAAITIPMEHSCPIPNEETTHHMEYELWDRSPSKGLITTKIEGTISIVQGCTGSTLAQFRVQVAIK